MRCPSCHSENPENPPWVWRADFAIFGDNTVNSAPRRQAMYDLPGGGLRFVTQARGIEYTMVNGEVLYEHQKHSVGLLGGVIRSGAAIKNYGVRR